MNLTLTLWELLGALGALAAAFLGLARLLLAQFERRLDDRFGAMDRARAEGQRAWTETFLQHVNIEQREFDTLRNLDHSFMEFRANLPMTYIRRDELRDYLVRLDIRFDTMNEKLNRLLKEDHHPETDAHDPS